MEETKSHLVGEAYRSLAEMNNASLADNPGKFMNDSTTDTRVTKFGQSSAQSSAPVH